MRDDQRKLESGVHVVVGTPGRVNDMIQRQSLRKHSFISDFSSECISSGELLGDYWFDPDNDCVSFQ